jgi:predicted metal-dependent hydrolase
MFSSILKSTRSSIEYTVAHRPRVTRRLHLELDESGGLVVVAPRSWSNAQIRKTVAQHKNQIARFLERARHRQTPALQYVDGSTHLYLGRQLSLSVKVAGVGSGDVSVCDDYLTVHVRNDEPDSVKTALQRWYRQQGLFVFSQQLRGISERTHWVKNIEVPLSTRRMKRTWGNCSSAGRVKLNVHLIKAPLEIVDSVICHELCHLQEMNHGKRFYALLEGLNPGWHKHRAHLRAHGFRYLQE